ncbi:MAG TPA: hypothetical protein VLF94_08645 [Chlamydiales bacterium]|nr:hypothetical protein [Chlamydiales bacterium]
MTPTTVNASASKDLIIEIPPTPSATDKAEPSKVNIFYDNKDIGLADANIGCLAIQQALMKFPEFEDIFHISGLAFGIWQSVKVYRATPDAATLTKSLVHPLFQLFVGPALTWVHPLLGKASIAVQFLAVARNSVPKLYTCLKNGKEKPIDALTGTALHVFNLATQGYFVKNRLDKVGSQEQARNDYQREWEDSEHQNGGFTGPIDCSGKPASAFEKMTNFERLTNPDLKPQTCPADATIMMNLQSDPKCEDATNKPAWEVIPNAVKDACASTCKEIARIFRKLSLEAHPDKVNGTKGAFINLANAQDTLNAKYSCKDLRRP